MGYIGQSQQETAAFPTALRLCGVSATLSPFEVPSISVSGRQPVALCVLAKGDFVVLFCVVDTHFLTQFTNKVEGHCSEGKEGVHRQVVCVYVCERERWRVWFLLDFVEAFCLPCFSGNSATITNSLFFVLSFACSSCSTRMHFLRKEEFIAFCDVTKSTDISLSLVTVDRCVFSLLPDISKVQQTVSIMVTLF